MSTKGYRASKATPGLSRNRQASNTADRAPADTSARADELTNKRNCFDADEIAPPPRHVKKMADGPSRMAEYSPPERLLLARK